MDVVPGTKPRRAGDRMPASYVNFYIGQGIVVMPSFDDPQDARAWETIQALFPGLRTIPEPLGRRPQPGKAPT